MDFSKTLEEFRNKLITKPLSTCVDTHRHPISGKTVIEVTSTLADANDDSTIRSVAVHTFDSATGFADYQMSSTLEDSSVVVKKTSRSGEYTVFLREAKTGTSLEVFSSQGLVHRQVIPSSVHSTVLKSGSTLSPDGIVWSADQNRFMYLADEPRPQTSIYKIKDQALNRYKFEESIQTNPSGPAVVEPSIFIFDIESRSLVKVKNPESSLKTGKQIYSSPVFTDPTGNSIVCVQLSMNDSQEISDGEVYKSKLAFVSLGELKDLKPSGTGFSVPSSKVVAVDRSNLKERSVLRPRVSPDFLNLAYLYVAETDNAPHYHFGLRVIDLSQESKPTKTLKQADCSDVTLSESIQGYLSTVTQYNWLDFSSLIVATKSPESTVGLAKIDLETASVTAIASYQSEDLDLLAILSPLSLLVRRRSALESVLAIITIKAETVEHAELTPIRKDKLKVEHTIVEQKGLKGQLLDAGDSSLENKPLVVWILDELDRTKDQAVLEFLLQRGIRVLLIDASQFGRGPGDEKNMLKGQGGKVEHHLVAELIKYLIEQKKSDSQNIHYYARGYSAYVGLRILQDYPKLLKSMSLYGPPVDTISMLYDTTQNVILQQAFLGSDSQIRNFPEDTSNDTLLKLLHNSIVNSDFSFSTSLLLAGGSKDPLVTPGSLRHLYKKLRASGCKVEYFEYPEEKSFLTNPVNIVDHSVKTIALFSSLWKFN